MARSTHVSTSPVRTLGLSLVALAAMAASAPAQTRSASITVTAQVMDIGWITTLPAAEWQAVAVTEHGAAAAPVGESRLVLRITPPQSHPAAVTVEASVFQGVPPVLAVMRCAADHPTPGTCVPVVTLAPDQPVVLHTVGRREMIRVNAVASPRRGTDAAVVYVTFAYVST